MHDLSPKPQDPPRRVSTGVPGLDDVLGGGLVAHRLYLVEGYPGSGKTTLALQFLFAGRARGERGLYITLSETAEELQLVAESHGWSLDDINLFELATAQSILSPDREMTLLHPWEVELGETIKLIVDEVERVRPSRVVFDSLSEMRLLAQDALRYRRQILSLKQFFAGRKISVLLLDDRSNANADSDLQLHSISHGVITLDRMTLDYGSARRRLEVQKMRGSRFREGWHDLVIRTGGLEVFPRLVAAEHRGVFLSEHVSSGNKGLDALLDGGPFRGTSTLLSGPAGTGKTSIAMQYVLAAAERGENSAVYEFDERTETLLTRCAATGLKLEPQIESGRVLLRTVDPAELSPGEFAAMVRDQIDAGTRIIVIDSLNGYLAAMPQEKQLLLQMHELLSFAAQQGVTTFLINPQQGLLGNTPMNLNISYIADAVVLLRFFEAGGRIHRAVSVIKNRGGGHEDTIRELRIDGNGLQVGEPLTDFHGVLTGTPTYTGTEAPLMATGRAELQGKP